MLITCEKCQAIYSVTEKVIGIKGRMVKCAKCAHVWMVEPEKPQEHIKKEGPSNTTALPKIKSPKFFQILSILLFTAICLVSLISFHDFFSKLPPLRYIYEKFGIYNNDGITLSDFVYQIKDESLLINGKMTNNSGIVKRLPDIRYILLDKDRSIIFSAVAKSSGKMMVPDETLPVYAKIANLSEHAIYLQLDIFNKLELSIRK